ncbi:DUF4221 family protein [uncultured Parabacteroides sp.]|uniref:DUF4221 family protein n=1 Tax=uncultured Parabacteroides sp. TaxID=512312 RepID=UPI0025DBE8FF|nr:DUF4221 family protein [uncultured Parabacteroides sp.]
MNKYIYFIIYLFFSTLSSCIQEKKEDRYKLVKTDVELSFPIDSQTRNYPKSMFLYKDNNNVEYMTFQNQEKNEILLYDISTCKLKTKIKYDIEGNNGVGFMWGYYIHNLDSIFLTSRDLSEIYLTDSNGNVKNTYLYDMSKDSISIDNYCSISFLYMPMILKDNHLIIVRGCNRHSTPNPICASIDLKTKVVQTYTYEYPVLPNTDNKQKRAGIELYFSRCFNNKNFIYSFYYDEDLYIQDNTQQKLTKKKAKSSFIEKVVVPDDYGKTTLKEMCEIPNYGNILYDPYRDVYYRIAYPATEIDKQIKPLELMDFGRKKFSIIILDHDLNVIGETLLPENTYNSSLIFIRKDGLYISNSHYLNSNYDDDILSFSKFELKKK